MIYRNGVATVSSSVTLPLYWNHLVYQQNSWGDWWKWANGSWVATTDLRVTTAPVVADTQPPSVGISSPSNGSVINRRATITAAAVATDNVGVKEVRFSLNGTTCVSSSAPFRCQLPVPGKRGWSGPLTAEAVDAAGNIGRQSITISTQ